MVGFRRVIDMLSRSRKPVVGHNLFLDLIMMYQQFYAPLPESSEAFKSRLSVLFPTITDTKYMASVYTKYQTTNLEELYNAITKSPFELPFIGLDSGFRTYIGTRFHEAGFDAYASGSVYLKVVSNIHMKVVNTIPIPRSDSLLVLDGPDYVPDRSRVFHVYGIAEFNRYTSEVQLAKQFAQFGTVSIVWIDDVSVYVCINPPNRPVDVPLDERTRKEICATSQYKVVPYDAYQHSINGNHGMHHERKAGRISVSLRRNSSSLSLEELQEIQVHPSNSHEEIDADQNVDPARSCLLL